MSQQVGTKLKTSIPVFLEEITISPLASQRIINGLTGVANELFKGLVDWRWIVNNWSAQIWAHKGSKIDGWLEINAQIPTINDLFIIYVEPDRWYYKKSYRDNYPVQ